MSDSMLEMIRAEASELLEELEQALLALEEEPDDGDLVNRIFRAVHTIKGSASIYGLQEVQDLGHVVETAFDLVRESERIVDKELLDATLASRDMFWVLIDAPAEVEGAEYQDLVGRFEAWIEGRETSAGLGEQQKAAEEPESVVPAAPDKELVIDDFDASEAAPSAEPGEAFHIVYRPDPQGALLQVDPQGVLDDLRSVADLQLFARVERLPALEALDVNDCYLWWEMVAVSAEDENRLRDAFIFVEDRSEVSVAPVADPVQAAAEVRRAAIDAAALWSSDVPEFAPDDAPPEAEEVVSDDGPAPEAQEPEQAEKAPEAASVPAPESAPVRAASSGPAAGAQAAEHRKDDQASSIRVESYKVDDMVDLVGELVIAQARLNQVAGRLGDQGLFAVAEDMERLSNNLRDRTLSIRMLPIGTTFDRYRRLVRDMAGELGKDVRLALRGEETELDKTVIEQLGEPLMHILRNALDHGIETPDERRDQGKNPQGTLELAAEHSGGHVLIRITDDGRGFSRERIEAKALERGLIHEGAQLEEKEIYNLVFHPGFSAPEGDTAPAGVGVGMDVVKESIDALRGHVELDSEPGKGASVTIKLPLTLAIIEGLEVRVGSEYYILPLTAVEECVENQRNGDEEKSGKKIINLRSEIVPYVRLREWFSVPGEEQHIEQIIITSGDGRRTGIAVDEVIGQQQTVIKSIGSAFEHLDEVSGATVMGDGSMALIIDVPTLVRKVRNSVTAQA